MENINDFDGFVISQAQNKHLYTLTKLTQRYFPYANFTFEEVIRRFNDPNITYLVAISKGITIGFIDFSIKENNTVQLLGLAVLEEYRNKGIGKALMNAMFSKLNLIENERKMKINSIELMVAQDNLPAQKLYFDCGFEKKGLLNRKIFDKEVAIFVKDYKAV